MAIQKPTPRELALRHLHDALETGVRGSNRDAILAAIEELESSKRGALTDMHYRNTKPGGKLLDPDRPGLLMRNGKRSGPIWIYRHDDPETHKQIEMQFGKYPEMSVAEAREAWEGLRRQRLAGERPTLNGVTREAGMSIEQLAHRYITEYARKVKRSWMEDERMLHRHVLPKYGATPVSEFGPEQVAAILIEIKEGGAPREAEKVRAMLSTMFNVGRGKTRKISFLKGAWLPISAVNPVEGVMLERRAASNHKPTAGELRSYIRGLGALGDVGDVLRVQVETGSRIGEVAGMAWDELDLEAGIWSLPERRTKNGRPHKAMLARQTLERLSARRSNGSSFVFPAPRNPKQSTATNYIQHRLAISREALGVPPGFTSHSTRHAALTWLAEQGCPREVRDRISNHAPAGSVGVDHIYVSAELNRPAREWTQRWVDHLSMLEAENVVSLGDRSA